MSGARTANPVVGAQAPRGAPVLAVVHSLEAGGLETYLVNVLSAIDRRRFPCTIVTTGSTANWFADELAELGVGTVHCANPYSQVGYVRRFGKLVRETGARVVCDFRNDFAAPSLFAAARCGVPSRLALYRSSSIAFRPNLARRLYAGVLHRVTQRYATRIVGNSRKVLDSFYPGWEARAGERFVVSHNGINLAKFADGERDPELLRALGLDPHRPIVGHVGRLHRSKNHETLLRAFAQVRKAEPAAQLLLVGEGELRAPLETQIAQLGLKVHVALAGRRKDVPALLRCMDVFCFPSRYEGQPNALLEAMAAGLPAVASRIEEVQEVVPEAMRAYLCETDDAEAYAAAVVGLLRDAETRAALGAENRAHIRANFSLESSAERLVTLWERDLADAARAPGS